MERKGFPESYDVGAILRFLSSIKAGEEHVEAPVYSHLTYDVMPGEFVTIEPSRHPDLRGHQRASGPRAAGRWPHDPFLSDFFDFSIYMDADRRLDPRLVCRPLHAAARRPPSGIPQSFFHRYSQLSDELALAIAEGLWENINLKNLDENILPTRPRADLILRKGTNHLVEEVALRKL